MLTLIQQSICAIELIGLRLLQRDTEVTALRKVRDELLATTPSGREWIALFERVQFPVLALVLADKTCSATAAALLEKTGGLLRDDASVVTAQEVEKASRLLGELGSRAQSVTQRKDLEAVARRVRQLAGRRTRDAVEALMHTGPHPAPTH